MNKNSLRTYLSSSYQGARSFLEHIIHPIFGKEHFADEYEAEILTNQPEYEGLAAAAGIQSIKQVGKVYVGVEPLQIFDITVGSQVHMARNRVGNQQLIRRIMDTHSLAFMLFHYEDGGAESQESWEWRFTFCHKGASQTDTTSSKRFTFLLGPGQHCRTATDNFQRLIDKRGVVEVKDIEDAFSVEALNKEFFDKYRQHYATFVEYITGKRYVKQGGKWEEKQVSEPNAQLREQFCGDEKRVRDYVKKLLGRIVFLHYLQRKGWLGVPSDKAWGDGDRSFIQHLYEYATEAQQSDFITSVLSPLFYEALNTDRRADNDLFDTRVKFPKRGNKLRIPYLNGGLFDRDENAALLIKFPPEFFKDLLDFFAQYNFTIDENDPTDAQVGVDPEMLGRIFESLLEDNKEKGAYYTPKEIVQYMCRESLIAYLCTGIDQGTPEHQAISEFVKSYDAELLTGVELEGVGLGTKVLERLKEVKVCDPAIGSGAFPMGMLRELYNCRISLEDLSVSSAEIKSQIIKSNIYGVDIEQGAVDIARLRFWLSLVVDETTPTPLPNLDYKIMQGNSLLEWYEGVDLSTLTQRKEDGCVELFDDLADVYRRQLRQAISAYYGETDHDRKATLHQEISEAIDEQLKEQHYTVDLSGINVSANTHFFLWHTWFDEVFNRPSGRNGFDIVIGNPPYIQLQNNGGELAKIYQGYGFKGFARTGDIYCLFYERGYQLLREGGHLCYITSNKWMRAGYGEKIRGFLADNTNPILLVDFAGIKVFEGATVDTNILLFSKEKNEGKTLSVSLTKDVQLGRGELCQYVQQHATPSAFTTSESWVILSPIEQSIKRKIEAVGKPLKDWDIQINYGIKTGCNEAFIIDEAKRAEILSNCQSDDERKRTEAIIRPILRGRDIRRYGYDWAGLYIIGTFPALKLDIESYPSLKQYLLDFGYDRLKQTGDKGARKKTSNQWFETQDSISYWEDFNKPKIVWGEISDRSKFAYEARGGYMVEATTFLMVGCHLPLLFCMLNSLLLEWLFSKVGTTTGVGTVRWKKYTIEQLTLPLFSEIEIEFFARCVASYLDGTLSTSEFASNTNQKIYELLELTQDEIDLVENLYLRGCD